MRAAVLLSSLTFTALASVAVAQFDLSKLTKAVDTAKDVGKALKSVAGIGPEEEAAIGDSVALEIVAKYGFVRDEAITQRLNLVGRGLARYSDRPHLNWRFGLLASDTVNAFSAPDGYVFITRGLYDLVADNDDALAAVLGHEIAHITERHALKIVARGEFLGALTNQLAQRSSDFRKAEAQVKQFGVGINQITTTLFEKGFDPASEFTADKKGRELAVTTGYAPGALRLVLLRLQQRGGDATAVFSTHPPISERLKRLPADPAPSAAGAPAPANSPAAVPASVTPAATAEEKELAEKLSEDDEEFFKAAEEPKQTGKKKP